MTGESRLDAFERGDAVRRREPLPLTLGLAASAFVVFGHVFGGRRRVPLPAACSGWWRCLLLYGLGFVMRLERRGVQMSTEPEIPLATKIELLLGARHHSRRPGAARISIGGYALPVVFRSSRATAKYIHAEGPRAVALACDAVDDAGSAPPHRLRCEDDPASSASIVVGHIAVRFHWRLASPQTSTRRFSRSAASAMPA